MGFKAVIVINDKQELWWVAFVTRVVPFRTSKTQSCSPSLLKCLCGKAVADGVEADGVEDRIGAGVNDNGVVRFGGCSEDETFEEGPNRVFKSRVKSSHVPIKGVRAIECRKGELGGTYVEAVGWRCSGVDDGFWFSSIGHELVIWMPRLLQWVEDPVWEAWCKIIDLLEVSSRSPIFTVFSVGENDAQMCFEMFELNYGYAYPVFVRCLDWMGMPTQYFCDHGSGWEIDDVADEDYEEALVFDDDPQYDEEVVTRDVGVNLVVRRSCVTPKAVGDD
nr:reverse transcriptase domain-containing protein [Tanacetum cinerariifolium]